MAVKVAALCSTVFYLGDIQLLFSEYNIIYIY